MNFTKRYDKLNKAQRQAVDSIDGPVMVIAGPGTGKTELLSVRIANILQKTDTLPENILCLTFTDSGAAAMRQRLTDIIGKEAYKVAIHTFHSFGTEIINQYSDYFYNGAHFKAADNLSSYEILRDIFDELSYGNPLASKNNGEYTHIQDSIKVISEIKRSGLTGDELLHVIEENELTIEKTNRILSPIFSKRISKSIIEQLVPAINKIREINFDISIPSIVSLPQIIADSLQSAVEDALTTDKTSSITAWKEKWLENDENKDKVLKSGRSQKKLKLVCYIYQQYLQKMQEASLYDFDDMILQVVHAIETRANLRYDLQERYQYILVDEFQDTNMAQMRILHNLTSGNAQDDTPNIMVVGDDDQAIYSFQGADISNILEFKNNYPKLKTITLTDNYRSTEKILKGSRDIILQSNDRLENRFNDIDKTLTPHKEFNGSKTTIHEAESIINERHWLVQDIKNAIENGQKPSDIAVLTRQHREINSLLPYFNKSGIAVSYERKDNILEQPIIILLEKIARLIINIAQGHHDEVNAQLPEILANPIWGIDPTELWKLSLKAFNSRQSWLEIMATTPNLIPIQNWLICQASQINETSLEQMLDIIIGNPNSQTQNEENDFVSPIYEHYFAKDKIINNPNEYLICLESLRTIRSKLREYRPDQIPTLTTFTDFISLNRKIGSPISLIRQINQSDDAVNIMTVHKSKGLEFNTVYIFNAIDTAWGEKVRNPNRLINYPENLNLANAGSTIDERLRLFYVAATRAKHNLHISYSLSNDNGKSTLKAAFLASSGWPVEHISAPNTIDQLIEATELAWYQPVVDPITTTMRELLLPTLENYKLSVTHLQNFLDVTRGGPETFLLNNLLRFPSAKNASSAFGTVIHNTLQRAHAHISATGKAQAIEDILSNFETELRDQHLSQQDFEKFLSRGSDALQAFLDKKYQSFLPSQKTELSFANQHSIIGEAHLNGKLDLVDIDKPSKTIIVTDYKTGNPPANWNGKTDYEKAKLHRYKQQLLFYKILVENSRDYHEYKVDCGVMQFVEPDKVSNLIELSMQFTNEEIERFSRLINAVWGKITNLDLPDISNYEKNIKGMLAFEQDLLDEKI